MKRDITPLIIVALWLSSLASLVFVWHKAAITAKDEWTALRADAAKCAVIAKEKP